MSGRKLVKEVCEYCFGTNTNPYSIHQESLFPYDFRMDDCDRHYWRRRWNIMEQAVPARPPKPELGKAANRRGNYIGRAPWINWRYNPRPLQGSVSARAVYLFRLSAWKFEINNRVAKNLAAKRVRRFNTNKRQLFWAMLEKTWRSEYE